MFDEQPDGDPHGECAAEIARLQALIDEHNEGCIAACKARNQNHCGDYTRRGKHCPDCPRDWIVAS